MISEVVRYVSTKDIEETFAVDIGCGRRKRDRRSIVGVYDFDDEPAVFETDHEEILCKRETTTVCSRPGSLGLLWRD